MKTIRIFYVMLACSFLFSCGNDEETKTDDYDNLIEPTNYKVLIESAECTNIPRPPDTYVYPIVPGTDEWLELHQKGMDEVVKACRVPESVLQKQSTQAVIQTYFDYPYVLNMYYSSSTYLDGFLRGHEFNSAYAELLKREDAGICLLERYLIFNPIGCGMATFICPVLELLLSQPEYYSQLNLDEKKELVKAALNKITTRIEFDPLSVHDNRTTCMLIGRVMLSAEFTPFAEEVKNNSLLYQYIETQSHQYSDYDTIISFANLFIK